MSRSQRKKNFIDTHVQGALLRRICAHWLVFFFVAAFAVILLQTLLGDPSKTLVQRLRFETGEFMGGASNALSFRIGISNTVLSFDFEAGTNEGWTSGDTGDNATTGLWARGNPNGTAAQPEDDHTVPGDLCWFTGQGTVGGAIGGNDVDGGTTSLLSPIIDASSFGVMEVTTGLGTPMMQAIVPTRTSLLFRSPTTAAQVGLQR